MKDRERGVLDDLKIVPNGEFPHFCELVIKGEQVRRQIRIGSAKAFERSDAKIEHPVIAQKVDCTFDRWRCHELDLESAWQTGP